jgi:TolB protein
MLKKILRHLFKRQRSRLTVIHADGSNRRVIFETAGLIEAPNWSPDGKWLVFNGDGLLFRIDVTDAAAMRIPVMIKTGEICGVTNDHVIAPDGKAIFFTANGIVYSVPFLGGTVQQVSMQHASGALTHYYVHGISPDGHTLSCIGYTAGRSDALAVYLLPAAGGEATRITHTEKPVDGAEFSPDGQWIYFNGELHAEVPGHSQLYRMRVDGRDIQQLTFDSRVNWFPHISPNGKTLVYLSYAAGTQGHPANVDVILRRLVVDGGEPEDVVALYGGQGTINTNSWSPDGQQFAFVEF